MYELRSADRILAILLLQHYILPVLRNHLPIRKSSSSLSANRTRKWPFPVWYYLPGIALIIRCAFTIRSFALAMVRVLPRWSEERFRVLSIPCIES